MKQDAFTSFLSKLRPPLSGVQHRSPDRAGRSGRWRPLQSLIQRLTGASRGARCAFSVLANGQAMKPSRDPL